jgi:hypothetical protein
MPVWKYRRIEDMPEAWEMNGHVPLGRRIRAVLSLGRLIEPLQMPRGVRKFRSFEDLAADRERYEDARIARIRAARK